MAKLGSAAPGAEGYGPAAGGQGPGVVAEVVEGAVLAALGGVAGASQGDCSAK